MFRLPRRIFAEVIWAARRRTLTLARDRMAQKP
jgi:asparagine synthetase B (glutamine-hydrolysing)